MVLTYLETIILYCISQIHGERSIYSIFHLLKGKKSSQTIQDAHLFQLAKLFQTFPAIMREEFEESIVRCKQTNLVMEISDQHYLLTSKGQSELTKQLNEFPLPNYLNGWHYNAKTAVFWERLSLLIQVCSNLVHQRAEYIPVQRKTDTQLWLKRFLQQSSKDRKDLAKSLYQEIVSCFDTEPSLEPALLVIRLTGYDRIGLTSQQAANFFKQELMYYQLLFINLLHFTLDTILHNPNEYPLLSSIIADLNQPYSFTLSTSKTYTLLQKGFTIDEIAVIRKLKRSTIEDHLVEIALFDKSFDINNIVAPEKQNRILAAAVKAESKQLKHIRQHAEDVEYFEIRLVMAKFGDSKWN